MGPARKDSDVLWARHYYARRNQRRNFLRYFSLRVLSSWCRVVWNLNYTVGRQKALSLLDGERVKKWAHKNAYTLIFLATFFFITWVITVVTGYEF